MSPRANGPTPPRRSAGRGAGGGRSPSVAKTTAGAGAGAGAGAALSTPNGSGAAIVVFTQRDRTRSLIRSAFPRRRARVVLARSFDDFEAAFRHGLVDAAIVDVLGANDETWRAAALAPEFPSAPFFGLTALRAAEAPALSQCASLDFADMLVEGVDDPIARDLVARQGFTARFVEALTDPPPALALDSPLQQKAWRFIISHAGRPVRTSALAQTLRVTREHLSRTFAAGGAPNLKRVIDLVRIIAAAELAKNPGYDLRDVARVLGFASSSHLSSTALRIVGTRPLSLARLRAVDLLARFLEGHGRSRGSAGGLRGSARRPPPAQPPA